MKNIRRYRGELGMTQEELARELGVSRMTVINMETDPSYTMGRENTRKLAEIFHCGIYDIVNVRDALGYQPVSREDRQALVSQVLREYATDD